MTHLGSRATRLNACYRIREDLHKDSELVDYVKSLDAYANRNDISDQASRK